MPASESPAAALSSICCFQFRGFFLLIAIASSHGIKVAAAEGGGGGGDEFCQWEIFQAECPGPDEVLLMTEAFYGRMRLGRCIQRDFGFIDCGVNVLPVVGRFCSARRRCSFSVTTLHGNHNCPMDLTAYLATKYTCLKITQCRPSFCQKTETIRLSSVDGGYLSGGGGVGMASGGVGGGGGGPCGSLNCPWRLEAEPGQRINLTLLDFSSSSSSSSSSDASAPSPSSSSSSDSGPSTVCYLYASIRDGAVLKDLTGCSRPEQRRTIAAKRPAHGEQQQQQHSNSAGYLTEGNSVQITLYTSHSNSVHFLIRYQAFGCPTIQPPTNSRAEREEDGGGKGDGKGEGKGDGGEDEQLVIRCLHSDQVYRLRCTGSSWVGQVGSCDSPLVNNQENGSPEDSQNRANKSPSLAGVLVIVGLGIVIGVAIGFTLLVVVTCCIRRKSLANPSTNQLSSPVYWKTQSELVYHEDVYSCSGDHSSSLSPIDRDYTVTKAIPYSAVASTGPLPASTAALTSGGSYSSTDYFSADCPRRKSTVTHVVLKSRPITQQQQQQQQQSNMQEHQKGSSVRLKEHLYEMPVAPLPVETTEFTAIDCIGHCPGIAANDKPNTYF